MTRFVARKKPRNKLSMDDVVDIRNSREKGIDLAKRYRVSRSTISRIRNYKTWEEDA